MARTLKGGSSRMFGPTKKEFRFGQTKKNTLFMDFVELPLLPSSSGAEASNLLDISKTGVVYISRIPPKMTPAILRSLLTPYGTIGRIYLVPKGRAIKINLYLTIILSAILLFCFLL